MTSIPIAETTTPRSSLAAVAPAADRADRVGRGRPSDLAPTAPPTAEHNRVLAALGEDVLARLLPHATLRSMGSRETIFAEDDAADAVYFPLTGMVSVLARAGEDLVEVATVGREGLLNNPYLFGGRTYGMRAVAPFKTTVLRLDASVAGDVLAGRSPASERARRHAGVLVAQLARTAACHHWHDVSGRCARWLLLARERAGDYFTVTQELLSELLGVRRASVNGAATALQKVGAIDYSRGRVKIVDVDALQAAACPCHGAYRAELALLSGDRLA